MYKVRHFEMSCAKDEATRPMILCPIVNQGNHPLNTNIEKAYPTCPGLALPSTDVWSLLPLAQSWPHGPRVFADVIEVIIHLLKNMLYFPLLVFRGNLSLLEICCFCLGGA